VGTLKWYSGPLCQTCYRKKWYQLNKNSKQHKKRKIDYYRKNKEKIKTYRKIYGLNNKDKERELKKKWYSLNKGTIKSRDRRKYMRKWRKNKLLNEPAFKIKCNLRSRLSNALRRSQKAGSAVKDLGCSISELKSYLESKFEPGMSWNNYGKWHIDHIKPLASFDLTDRSEFLKACHYTNLQPLWAIDNLKKGDELLYSFDFFDR
jgi:hypothetical protein